MAATAGGGGSALAKVLASLPDEALLPRWGLPPTCRRLGASHPQLPCPVLRGAAGLAASLAGSCLAAAASLHG